MFKDFEAAQARRESAKISRKKKLTTIGLMLASFVLGWNHLWIFSTNNTASVAASTENAIMPDAQPNASLSVQSPQEEVSGAATTSAVPTTSTATTVAPVENPNQVSISLELPKPEPITTQSADPVAAEPGLNTPIVIPDPSANSMSTLTAPQTNEEIE